MRLVYENIAIGIILQRIAECRIVNTIPNLIPLLTQQSPAEQKYRDMPITTGDKIIIIEFKAPTFDKRESVFNYEFNGAQIRKLVELHNDTNGNVFIGLIHAKLLPEIRGSGSSPSAYYKVFAVPSTTLFIPAEILLDLGIVKSVDEFKRKKGIKDDRQVRVILKLNDIVHDEEYKESLFPECVLFENFATYLPNSETCQTCGGFSRMWCRRINRHVIICHCIGCKELKLTYDIDSQLRDIKIWSPAYSLSEILTLLRSCRIGYRLAGYDIINKIIKDIMDYLLNTLVIVYSPMTGFIPLLIKASTAERLPS